jgi:hypothetical protein
MPQASKYTENAESGMIEIDSEGIKIHGTRRL